MPFDDIARGKLQTFVGDARDLLAEEFACQLQQTYGMDPVSGTVSSLDRLSHLDDQTLETARILRDILDHYLGGSANPSTEERRHALERIAREQAFTVLNRLAALRMMEARGILLEGIAKGYQSKAFQLYQRVAGSALGETGDTYRTFLFSIFDMFVSELPGLFDRHSPSGRLFPSEAALLRLLALMNAHELEAMWGEDETIGWIYQYFNSQAERKRMRKESGAPRNSRELAVRNQFFTPRYVVEFLVDNTLARQWFDQMGGRTALADRCRFMVVKPEEMTGERPARPRDPRGIKLLDPACGSMHFGLYAFDIFETIYHEAWSFERENGAGSLSGADGLKPLTAEYSDEDAFRRDVPRLILERNIYGVDIDPRAAQIASLALWLRAQRAWHVADVKRTNRPTVGRGNVVAAVAPPAETELRKKLMAQMDRMDAELFERALFMLAGLPEQGILLQAEKELPRLIRQVYGDQTDFFRGGTAKWEEIERRLRKALIKFAEASGSTYQGRLFARDALEGMRLMDVANEMFDVVVMNPPFGALSRGAKAELGKSYPTSKNDLLAIFIERGIGVLRRGGRLGAITSRTCFFLSTYQKWREGILLSLAPPIIVADLGHGVMDDAMVEAAAYVLGKV